MTTTSGRPARPVRLTDVARAAGVSQGTASNVFNKPHLVRVEVRERVREVAGSMGYHGPDPRGRLLRAGKADAIGVVATDELSFFFQDPYARRFMAGIARACDARGASLLTISAGRTTSGQTSIRSALVDGFIVYNFEDGVELLEPVKARGLPFVSVDFDGGRGSVRVNDHVAAHYIARHLTQLGHRRIGIASLAAPTSPYDERAVTDRMTASAALEASRFSTQRDRLRGICAALTEAGISLETTPAVQAPSTREMGRVAAARLLDGDEPLTALLCMSDVLAIGAVDLLKERGVDVPGEMSVTGFDGLPLAARCDPPLATMAQPIEEKGVRAAELLFENADRAVELDVTFVPGASTAPPAR